MATKKLILEIPESLYKQLAEVAEFNDRSIESLALQIITRSLPPLAKKVTNLRKMLDQVTPDNLHGEVNFGEPVGREVW